MYMGGTSKNSRWVSGGGGSRKEEIRVKLVRVSGGYSIVCGGGEQQ